MTGWEIVAVTEAGGARCIVLERIVAEPMTGRPRALATALDRNVEQFWADVRPHDGRWQVHSAGSDACTWPTRDLAAQHATKLLRQHLRLDPVEPAPSPRPVPPESRADRLTREAREHEARSRESELRWAYVRSS